MLKISDVICDEPYFVSDTNDTICPNECPFMSFNDLWNCIGVCTSSDKCSLYNPLLNYADEESKKCLPCLISGCIKCIKNMNVLNKTNLPDICLECMSGYKLSNDNKRCYLIYEEIFLNYFNYIFIIFIIFFIILFYYFIKRFNKINFILLRLAFEHRTLSKFRDHQRFGNPLYPLNINLSQTDIAGIGLILYYRFISFISFISIIFMITTLFECYLPFNKLIQTYRNLESAMPFQNCSFLKKYIYKKITRLIDFKTTDWIAFDLFKIITKFKENAIVISSIRYIICMLVTFCFIINQKKFVMNKLNNSFNMMDIALSISNIPNNILEKDIQEFFEKLIKKKIIGVSICYDYYHIKKEITELIENHIELTEIKMKMEKIYEGWVVDKKFNSFKNIKSFLKYIEKKKMNKINLDENKECITNKRKKKNIMNNNLNLLNPIVRKNKKKDKYMKYKEYKNSDEKKIKLNLKNIKNFRSNNIINFIKKKKEK